MKKSIIFLFFLNAFIFQIAFCQTMNIYTKTGVTSFKLSDIDSINFTSSTSPSVQIPVLITSEVISIANTTASCGGTITNDGGLPITTRGVCWSAENNPTVTDSKTVNGTGTGSFSSNITGLTANTIYYVRAYATNSSGTGYGNTVSFKTESGEGTVTDIDGNVYNYITIGSQVWMIENLKTTKYRNGDSLPNITSAGGWNNLTSGAYCNYDNNFNNAATYGRLYNWYAVNDSRGLAPAGWHVPTDTDWTTLVTYLGGENIAGGRLKETGTMHWLSPNTGATNETGFTALPVGGRDINGIFFDLGSFGNWWSSTETNTNFTWYRHMYYNYGGISRVYSNKKGGCAIRCIKN